MSYSSDQSRIEAVKKEIDHFRDLSNRLLAKYGGSELFDDVFCIGSSNDADAFKSSLDNYQKQNHNTKKTKSFFKKKPSHFDSLKSKRFPLVMSALIHGNEVAGVSSMNMFLEYLLYGSLELSFPLVVFLGNVQAAYKGLRYLDRDLNRCFALDENISTEDSVEVKRVNQLKQVLCDSAFYLDLHQTIGLCPIGFFIFAFRRSCFDFARSIAPRVDIVTYWTGAYTSEGMCSDQFVHNHGGVAVTMELGNKSFDCDKIALGLQGLLSALGYVKRFLVEGKSPELHDKLHEAYNFGRIFTWLKIIEYPASGEVMPNLDLKNFQKINKGDKIATVDGQSICCDVDGYSLFASRLHATSDQIQRPYELIRILKIIQEDDLPFCEK